MSGLFLCKAAKQACLVERMSLKKATSTRSGLVESFGLDQFGGKSAERSEADNPFLVLNEMRRGSRRNEVKPTIPF